MSAVASVMMALACALAGAAGTCAGCAGGERHRAAERRREVRRRAGATEASSETAAGGDATSAIAHYAVGLSRRLAFKVTRPLVPQRRRQGVRGSAPEAEGRAGTWFREHAAKAGLAPELSTEGYREARVRLALAFAVAGGLVGAALSNELAALLGLGGLLAGAMSPRWAVRAAERQRTEEVERHLSEMLEVVALGLRSGLSFDRSFELYGSHFASPLARASASARRRWSLGLATREEALRGLAASYDSDQLARVIENVVRSLRFGSSLAESLESAAAEARAEHRARMEEKVAKAPVKMMMPTGALILPAMLLLVLGPVLLELANGM